MATSFASQNDCMVLALPICCRLLATAAHSVHKWHWVISVLGSSQQSELLWLKQKNALLNTMATTVIIISLLISFLGFETVSHNSASQVVVSLPTCLHATKVACLAAQFWPFSCMPCTSHVPMANNIETSCHLHWHPNFHDVGHVGDGAHDLSSWQNWSKKCRLFAICFLLSYFEIHQLDECKHQHCDIDAIVNKKRTGLVSPASLLLISLNGLISKTSWAACCNVFCNMEKHCLKADDDSFSLSISLLSISFLDQRNKIPGIPTFLFVLILWLNFKKIQQNWFCQVAHEWISYAWHLLSGSELNKNAIRLKFVLSVQNFFSLHQSQKMANNCFIQWDCLLVVLMSHSNVFVDHLRGKAPKRRMLIKCFKVFCKHQNWRSAKWCSGRFAFCLKNGVLFSEASVQKFICPLINWSNLFVGFCNLSCHDIFDLEQQSDAKTNNCIFMQRHAHHNKWDLWNWKWGWNQNVC